MTACPPYVGNLILLPALLLLASACSTAIAPGHVPCREFGRIKECATVPLATPAEEAAAKGMAPPQSGRAMLILARPYTHQRLETAAVYMDGSLVGHLAPQTFLKLDVSPGSHTVRVAGADDNSPATTLNLEAGESAFLKYHITMLFSRFTGKLTQVEEADARSILSRLRMAAAVKSD